MQSAGQNMSNECTVILDDSCMIIKLYGKILVLWQLHPSCYHQTVHLECSVGQVMLYVLQSVNIMRYKENNVERLFFPKRKMKLLKMLLSERIFGLFEAKVTNRLFALNFYCNICHHSNDNI
jgi:hypothetical protein